MSNLNDNTNDNKFLQQKKLFAQISRQISIANSSENILTTDVTLSKSDNSFKPNHIQLTKRNNGSIQRYKSSHMNPPQAKQRCTNRVTFVDQVLHIPFASITLIESFKRYNSQNTYESFGSADDSKKSNCCCII